MKLNLETALATLTLGAALSASAIAQSANWHQMPTRTTIEGIEQHGVSGTGYSDDPGEWAGLMVRCNSERDLDILAWISVLDKDTLLDPTARIKTDASGVTDWPAGVDPTNDTLFMSHPNELKNKLFVSNCFYIEMTIKGNRPVTARFDMTGFRQQYMQACGAWDR